jgi:flagellar motility protein MotE (MotC chaperone)
MSMRTAVFAACWLVFFLCFLAVRPVSAQNATAWNGTEEIDSVQERRILVSLKQERQELQRKKDRIARREKELKVLRQEVEKKLQQLRQWRGDLEDLLARKEKKERKRVQKLSRIYQRMDPVKAAAALGSVKQDLAVGIISQMRSGTAAEVLDNMDKEQAAALSTDLSRLEQQKDE